MGTHYGDGANWTIPRIWDGDTVFVLGGGPTLPRMNLKSIVHRHVLGVNHCFRLGPWVDLCFFGDAKFYWWNRADLLRFENWKVTVNAQWPGRDKSVAGEPGIKILRKGASFGLEKDPECLAWNRSSGGCAVNLAAQLGAKRIVLVGYDMRQVDGEKNWMPHPLEKTKKNPYDFMKGAFGRVAAAARQQRIEILNATPDSGLEEFKKVKLEDVA